ncbi:TetR/AcrR family transcriptional regulator [Brevibacterium renqingii]|uniref:TetR/AcrR family transcriptional regulator n=1 Tax=Brevibacterium renqingii TaxID=2776916 RepID=UPI001AE0343E|nr:TetR/AcrR family transcriptional regulator [Brevibacterium renqingii]
MDSVPPLKTSSRRWHGTLRAERDSARRERLLDAALELYGTSGFRRTGVQALCQESGVSSRSFYELFSTQEDLLEQLYVALNAEIATALTQTRVTEGSALIEATRQLVSAALTPMLKDERKARVLEVEAVGISESMEERRRSTMRLLADSVHGAFVELARSYDLEDRTIHRIAASSESGEDLTSLIIVGGITEALVQRVGTSTESRSATSDFLGSIAEVVLRAHGIPDCQFDALPA